MNAYEIAEHFDVDLPKAKKIAKALSAPKSMDARSAKIRLHLSQDRQLSARELLVLLGNPGIIPKLGTYESNARAQLSRLGNVMTGAAPNEVTEHVCEAAAGDAHSLVIIMRWLKLMLPPESVRFHWIAVRLLVHKWPNLHNGDFWRVNLALRNVRAHPDFDGWWDYEKIGSHLPVVYRRPRLQFDL